MRTKFKQQGMPIMNDQDDKKNELSEEEIEALERAELFKPLTKEDFLDNNVTQIQVDALNVTEGRVDILTFPKPYQQKIRDFYRFSPLSVGSPNGSINGGRNFWK